MKKIIWIYVIIFFATFIFSENLGTLPEVLRPDMISVYGDELYIAEGANFSVYSLADLKLLRKFGKKGEGPGELVVLPNFPNKITVLKDQVFVTGIGKAISFSKEGKFLKEFRTGQRVLQLIPVGENFVSKEQGVDTEQKAIYTIVALYNSDMKKIKELYRQLWPQQGGTPPRKLDMTLDFLSVEVYENKIFIEKSQEGFIIDVFDSSGSKLYTINKKIKKHGLTQEDKDKIIAKFKEDPAIKDVAKQVGGWAGVKKLFKMEFPEAFPPIKGFEISNHKIYINTYIEKDNKIEYIVMDLKGNISKTTYIPKFLEPEIFPQIAGAKLYSIFNGNLYYIAENEDEEEWELFKIKI